MLKKTVVLLIALQAVGVAHAQSSVTLYGVVDSGLRYTNNGHGAVATMNANGWLSSSRFGFLGREDLGGGWATLFQLETGFNPSNGALDNTNGLLFNRMAYVGFVGPYGTLTVGRQWDVSHDIVYNLDPFYLQYPDLTGLTSALDGVHYSNDVKYRGDLGALMVTFENSFGGVAGDFNAGSARSAGMLYRGGFFDVGASYTYRNIQVGNSYVPDDFYLLGTAVKFGPVRFAGGFMNENQDGIVKTAAPVRTENYWAGVTYDINSFARVGGALYVTNLPDSDGKRNLGILSLTYFLSKRTTLFAESDFTRYSGSYVTNTTLNPSKAKHQIAATVGIDHTF